MQTAAADFIYSVWMSGCGASPGGLARRDTTSGLDENCSRQRLITWPRTTALHAQVHQFKPEKINITYWRPAILHSTSKICMQFYRSSSSVHAPLIQEILPLKIFLANKLPTTKNFTVEHKSPRRRTRWNTNTTKTTITHSD